MKNRKHWEIMALAVATGMTIPAVTALAAGAKHPIVVYLLLFVAGVIFFALWKPRPGD